MQRLRPILDSSPCPRLNRFSRLHLQAVLIPSSRYRRNQAAAQDGAEAEADRVINPASDTLTGVMLVGRQRRALCSHRRKCRALHWQRRPLLNDAEQILPATWSVHSIDLQRGCLQLAQAGKPQTALCLS